MDGTLFSCITQADSLLFEPEDVLLWLAGAGWGVGAGAGGVVRRAKEWEENHQGSLHSQTD